MAVRCAVVILGIRIPFAVLFTSNIALLSGEDPSVLTATCEKPVA
jgi:hypothetical protein